MTKFFCLFLIGLFLVCVLPLEAAEIPELQDYAKPGQLEPLPEGVASLYRTPWRDNVRTVSAYDALQGVGVYYKHIPAWNLEQHSAVMTQMAAAGVKRLRIAPHYSMYLSKDWTAPSEAEQKDLRDTLRACKLTGIRPCVIFVHVPEMGKGDEIQKWLTRTWNNGLMPAGEEGTPEDEVFFGKTYTAFKFLLQTARDAGFTDKNSYDLEMGQNLWWGFPALPPFPGMTMDMLRPGGQIFEFESRLLNQAQKDGYREANVLWGQSHHEFAQMLDSDLPTATNGRAISFYSVYAGVLEDGWTGSEPWPARPALKFAEGRAPKIILAKPEGFMADFSKHDNLIGPMLNSKKPLAITSLGVVPMDIPDALAHGFTGWDLKSRGLTRSLAFWLNQGASFVLLHSAYEGADDEMSHALMPFIKDPTKFTWQESKPLTTLHAFTEALATGEKLPQIEQLKFKYALEGDRVLIPATGKSAPLMASDAVALLSYQLSAKKFAVAAYIVTPNIAVPLPTTMTLTLQVDKKVDGKVTTQRPYTQQSGKVIILEQNDENTTMSLPIYDDVKWLIFDVK